MSSIKTKCKKLLISFLIFLTLFNVVAPTTVHAADIIFGSLFAPIMQFVCGIGDVVLNMLQTTMLPGAPEAVTQRHLADLYRNMKDEEAQEKWEQGDYLGAMGAKAQSVWTYWEDKLVNVGFLGLGDAYKWGSSVWKAGGAGPLAFISPLRWVKEIKDNADGADILYKQELIIPIIMYGPATIFSNMVPALDVNFINPSVEFVGGELKWDFDFESNTGMWNIDAKAEATPELILDEESPVDPETGQIKGNIASQLRGTIAKWYIALRNLAIVLMLSILVFIAIRIILSSSAGDVAKYKELLKDWFIGLCLLFTMHLIMALVLNGAQLLTELFSSMSDDETLIEATIGGEIDENGNQKKEKILIDNFLTTSRNFAVGVVDEDDLSSDTLATDNVDQGEEGEETEGYDYIVKKTADSKFDIGNMAGFTLIYVILVFYTLMFTWRYLKRLVYVMFLTIISPLVALTYPIDKVKDGSAQAFNMWTKEYVYNVLIQPVHLLLYVILIGAAQEFATENLIYTIVALGFLLESEKIFKTIFGFDKANGGEFSSAVTGGVLFGAAAGLVQRGSSAVKGRVGSGGSDGSGGNANNNTQAPGRKKLKLASAFGNGGNAAQSSSASPGIGSSSNNSGTRNLASRIRWTRYKDSITNRKFKKWIKQWI